MFNPLRTILLALLILTPISTLSAQPTKTRIAFILCLSGEAASLGEAIRNGFELGLEQVPQEIKDRMDIVFEDDRMLPLQTISSFRSLQAKSPVDIVLTASSGTSNALAPIAESAKVPMLAIATDPKVVKDRDYVFNFWVTPEEIIRPFLPEIRKRGYENIARVSTIQDAMEYFKKEFDQANKNEIGIVYNEEFTPEVKDFRTSIAKIKQLRKLDAIMLLLMPGQLGVFAKQARQQGIDVPFFGVEMLEDSNEVKASDGALYGAWYTNAANPDSSFEKKYKERFPKASQFAAGNGHDLALLVAKAVELYGSDKQKIAQFFDSLNDFSGALGTYSASGDNRFTLRAAVKEVTVDGFKEIR